MIMKLTSYREFKYHSLLCSSFVDITTGDAKHLCWSINTIYHYSWELAASVSCYITQWLPSSESPVVCHLGYLPDKWHHKTSLWPHNVLVTRQPVSLHCLYHVFRNILFWAWMWLFPTAKFPKVVSLVSSMYILWTPPPPFFLNLFLLEPSYMGLLLESGMVAGLLGHLTFVGHWLHPTGVFLVSPCHRMCQPEVLAP